VWILVPARATVRHSRGKGAATGSTFTSGRITGSSATAALPSAVLVDAQSGIASGVAVGAQAVWAIAAPVEVAAMAPAQPPVVMA
jgi:hypothetical protein